MKHVREVEGPKFQTMTVAPTQLEQRKGCGNMERKRDWKVPIKRKPKKLAQKTGDPAKRAQSKTVNATELAEMEEN